ncbi:hypothetical protein L484_016357 [Morus notabilis]|uniref:Uncharacterized protein n=1 Tax=Morus notabilis TaxID=981085 RepID=W9QEA1_9ROSA|nr:hypothetical protein L484_016353 [Morus notabilis]EXB29867.1 hypothetical protein L484_016357 [Morus notabilis]
MQIKLGGGSGISSAVKSRSSSETLSPLLFLSISYAQFISLCVVVFGFVEQLLVSSFDEP